MATALRSNGRKDPMLELRDEIDVRAAAEGVRDGVAAMVERAGAERVTGHAGRVAGVRGAACADSPSRD